MILTVACWAGPAQAQMYKWVDENGKVHFSDKKPTHHGATAQPLSSSANQQAERDFIIPKDRTPIVRPFESAARSLYIADMAYAWKLDTLNRSKYDVGSYHVDATCISRGSMTLPDAYLNHKSFFPDESRLSRQAERIIDGLDFSADTIHSDQLIAKIREAGAVGLKPLITGMNIRACAPRRYGEDKKKPGNKLDARRYSRAYVDVEIEWTLVDGHQNTLFQTTTTGSTHGWINSNVPAAFTEAVDNATRNLMSQQALVNQLIVQTIEPELSGTSIDLHNILDNKPGNSPARQIGLSIDTWSWLNHKKMGTRIGSYLYAGQCNSERAMSRGDALSSHSRLIIDDNTIVPGMRKLLLDRGYPAINLQRQPWPQSESDADYLVRGTVSGLFLNACAPRRDVSAKFLHPSQINSGELKRHKVRLDVKWTVMDPDTMSEVFHYSTSAIYGDYLSDNSVVNAFEGAWQLALANLYKEPEFKALITQENPGRLSISDFPRQQEHPTPPIRPEDLDLDFLLFSKEDFDIEVSLGQDYQAGTLFAGNTCSPALNQKISGIAPPSSASIAGIVTRTFNQLDFPARSTPPTALAKQQRDLKAHVIRARIQSLRFDTCYRNYSAVEIMQGRRSSLASHRGYITILWTVHDKDDNQVIYQREIVGVANNWDTQKNLQSIYIAMFEDNVRAFAGDPALIGALREDTDEDGIIDTLEGWWNDAVQSVSFSGQRAKSSLWNQLAMIKTRMASHYHDSGDWPNSLEQIGIQEQDILADGYVETIYMDGFGEIRFNLAAPSFDRGEYLLMKGDYNSMGVIFECRTNAPSLQDHFCGPI